MANHSSTLAWKIPWTEEPGGLPSMGSHRGWTQLKRLSSSSSSSTKEIAEVAQSSWHDSESTLPVFPRIRPSGLNGSYLGASVGSAVEVYWGNGACLN